MRHPALALAAILACTSATVALACGGPILEKEIAKPKEARPEERVAFPKIKDWSTLKITLDRTVCFGACPDYTVEIHGDGTVIYEGRDFVTVKGTQTAHIPEKSVKKLFEKFRAANYFWTFGEYTGSVTDMPTFKTSISFDGETKSVSDYAGRMAGIPKAIATLEAEIDMVANTKQWISGNGKLASR